MFPEIKWSGSKLSRSDRLPGWRSREQIDRSLRDAVYRCMETGAEAPRLTMSSPYGTPARLLTRGELMIG